MDVLSVLCSGVSHRWGPVKVLKAGGIGAHCQRNNRNPCTKPSQHFEGQSLAAAAYQIMISSAEVLLLKSDSHLNCSRVWIFSVTSEIQTGDKLRKNQDKCLATRKNIKCSSGLRCGDCVVKVFFFAPALTDSDLFLLHTRSACFTFYSITQTMTLFDCITHSFIQVCPICICGGASWCLAH